LWKALESQPEIPVSFRQTK